MQLKDFKIGKAFQVTYSGELWMCTDIGTRSICAIPVDEKEDPIWLQGPPYLIEEVVFTENEFAQCMTDMKDLIMERTDDFELRVHPGFDIDDVMKMMDERVELNSKDFKYPLLLKFDRVAEDQLHPYSARKAGEQWIVLFFRVFARTYGEMPAIDFARLPVAQKNDTARFAAQFKELSKKDGAKE